MVHTYTPRMWETGTRGLRVQSQLRLHIKTQSKSDHKNPATAEQTKRGNVWSIAASLGDLKQEGCEEGQR